MTPTMQPAPNLAPVEPVESPKESKKLIMWFVLGIIAIIILVGGTYLFLSRQQASLDQQTVVSPTPAPVVEENLEEDLDAIEVDAGKDSDFAQIDQDLEQL